MSREPSRSDPWSAPPSSGAPTRRQWILVRRPAGEPDEGCFELRAGPLPELADGEALVRVLYVSVDPYMRGRMRDAKSYVDPVGLGDVMGAGAVGEVVASRVPKLAPGDVVEGMFGWQTHAVTNGKGVRKIDPALAPISTALGVLGMPGLTAYFGLLDVGQPRAGETVLVTAATGAVGGLVGQLAKLHGCRAVGIAGGPEKCAFAVRELGYDVCLDHRGADLDDALGRAAPRGVDVFFDNVGGRVFDTALRHLALGARIAVCGMIAEYNLERPELAPRPNGALLVRRARMQGFIVTDYAKRYPEGLAQLAAWLGEGKLRYREDVLDGFEHLPRALLRLFRGENFGKQLVRVAEPAPGSARR